MSITWLEGLLLATALAATLVMRPWRLLHAGGLKALSTPMLATVALLPFVWTLPLDNALPLTLPASGACLVVLTVGWPLAVPLLALVGMAVCSFAGLLLAHALNALPMPLNFGAEVLTLWLLAMGEASVTAVVVVLLVTCLPRALATWSDGLYLKPAEPLRP
jgi:hypothetical protein